MDADAQIPLQPSEEPERRWHHLLLAPGDSESFFLKPPNLKELAEKYDFVIVRGNCRDIFGESHKIDEKIDLKEIQEAWQEAGIVLKEPLERKVEKITKELKEIRGEIRRIRRSQTR